jgi:hypothetical protein
MKLINYILLVDLFLLILFIKIIFKQFDVFVKSILFHFFPGEAVENPLDKWADKEDIAHKVNLLYAVVLGLFGLSFFIYNVV